MVRRGGGSGFTGGVVNVGEAFFTLFLFGASEVAGVNATEENKDDGEEDKEIRDHLAMSEDTALDLSGSTTSSYYTILPHLPPSLNVYIYKW